MVKEDCQGVKVNLRKYFNSSTETMARRHSWKLSRGRLRTEGRRHFLHREWWVNGMRYQSTLSMLNKWDLFRSNLKNFRNQLANRAHIDALNGLLWFSNALVSPFFLHFLIEKIFTKHNPSVIEKTPVCE